MDRYLNFSISDLVIQFLELACLKQPNVNFMAFFFSLSLSRKHWYLFLPQPLQKESQVSALFRENSNPISQLVGLVCNCSEPFPSFLLLAAGLELQSDLDSSLRGELTSAACPTTSLTDCQAQPTSPSGDPHLPLTCSVYTGCLAPG